MYAVACDHSQNCTTQIIASENFFTVMHVHQPNLQHPDHKDASEMGYFPANPTKMISGTPGAPSVCCDALHQALTDIYQHVVQKQRKYPIVWSARY